jgi:hypothetical protein
MNADDAVLLAAMARALELPGQGGLERQGTTLLREGKPIGTEAQQRALARLLVAAVDAGDVALVAAALRIWPLSSLPPPIAARVVHIAILAGCADCIHAMADSVDLPSLRLEGDALFFHACRLGTRDVVDAFIDAGARLEDRDAWDATPIIVAAAAGRFDIVNLLLDRGASGLARSASGLTVPILARRIAETPAWAPTGVEEEARRQALRRIEPGTEGAAC